MRRLLLAVTAGVLLLANQARACTTFCYQSQGTLVFGKNYDWNVDDGLVIVNKRGVTKTAFTEENPARWTTMRPLRYSKVAAAPVASATRKWMRADAPVIRTFVSHATTSSMLAELSSWNWIHCSVGSATRRSGSGYTVSSSHMSSTTSPFSLMPPLGNSRPY